MKGRALFTVLLLLCFPFFLSASTSLAPGSMGPKGLPVQKVGRVIINQTTYTDLFFMGSIEWEQEISFNPQIDFFIPWNDYAALLIQIEPFEFFSTSESLRLERSAHSRQGLYRGDIYFGMNLHLFENKKEAFNLHLNFLTKTPTGKAKESARHTDSLAYQVDIRFRKKINWLRSFPLMPEEILGYTGLVSWQTEGDDHNEAFCWALKLIYGPADLKFSFELGGFSGWKNNNDRPLVGSFEFMKIFPRYDFIVRYQYGFRDQIPHTLAIGFSYKYNRKRF